jgi:hypothetical protein
LLLFGEGTTHGLAKGDEADTRRHWPVFSASLAVVLIFWGLTPLQSSIFATKMIDKTLQVPAVLSTSYLSLQEQTTTSTGVYAQSVYNIAWLNESLPPFMNRQGMLAPFSLMDNNDTIQLAETWTTTTRFYSVDLNCEEPKYNGGGMNSSWGCFYGDYDLNLDSTLLKRGQYNTMYVGYWYEESMDSYLLGRCPEEANQTFLVRWSSTEAEVPVNKTSPLNFNTTLWCRPHYCEF